MALLMSEDQYFDYLRCLNDAALFFQRSDLDRLEKEENELISRAALMEYIHGQRWMQ